MGSNVSSPGSSPGVHPDFFQTYFVPVEADSTYGSELPSLVQGSKKELLLLLNHYKDAGQGKISEIKGRFERGESIAAQLLNSDEEIPQATREAALDLTWFLMGCSYEENGQLFTRGTSRFLMNENQSRRFKNFFKTCKEADAHRRISSHLKEETVGFQRGVDFKRREFPLDDKLMTVLCGRMKGENPEGTGFFLKVETEALSLTRPVAAAKHMFNWRKHNKTGGAQVVGGFPTRRETDGRKELEEHLKTLEKAAESAGILQRPTSGALPRRFSGLSKGGSVLSLFRPSRCVSVINEDTGSHSSSVQLVQRQESSASLATRSSLSSDRGGGIRCVSVISEGSEEEVRKESLGGASASSQENKRTLLHLPTIASGDNSCDDEEDEELKNSWSSTECLLDQEDETHSRVDVDDMRQRSPSIGSKSFTSDRERGSTDKFGPPVFMTHEKAVRIIQMANEAAAKGESEERLRPVFEAIDAFKLAEAESDIKHPELAHGKEAIVDLSHYIDLNARVTRL